MEILNVSIKDKNEIERFILINLIGLMNALTEKAITIDQCEVYLCSPYSVEKLNNLKVNRKIVELIEYGCELEDIESLVPKKLEKSINEIKIKAVKLLFDLTFIDKSKLKKWID